MKLESLQGLSPDLEVKIRIGSGVERKVVSHLVRGKKVTLVGIERGPLWHREKMKMLEWEGKKEAVKEFLEYALKQHSPAKDIDQDALKDHLEEWFKLKEGGLK